MEYQAFCNEIISKINEQLREVNGNAEATIMKTERNNDSMVESIVIRGSGQTMAPAFKIQGLYEESQNGHSLDQIAANTVEAYLTVSQDAPVSIADMINYEKMKDLVVLQLINKDFNVERLKSIPYQEIDHTDLAVMLRIQLDPQNSKVVDSELLNIWGIDSETVFKHAMENSVRIEPASIISMDEMMFSMLMDTAPELKAISDIQMEQGGLYTLSNHSMHYGASALLYPDVLEQLAANSNTNLIILPSSTHEVLLLMDDGEKDISGFQQMVASINMDCVSPEDVLSNGVYYYDKDEHMLSLVSTREQTADLKPQRLETAVKEELEAEEDLER